MFEVFGVLMVAITFATPLLLVALIVLWVRDARR